MKPAVVLLLLAGLLVAIAECGQAPSKTATPAPKAAKPAAVEFGLENVRFAVFERELSEPREYTSLKPNEKSSKQFQIDSHHKVQLKFDAKNKKASGESVILQQTFVAVTHQPSGREIIYVAEADKTTKTYTFELDMKTHLKDFTGVSGKYSMRLIIGDTSATNSMNWHFVDAEITVPSGEPSAQLPKSQRVSYDKLPEIKHKFREPEPRPLPVISDTFALLCALPLVLLFGLWLRVGINFGNAKYSLWALGFHAGLSAIFGLYVLYWLQLNMFQTLKYLAIIAAPTFFCGNLLLRSFAHSRGDDKHKSVE